MDVGAVKGIRQRIIGATPDHQREYLQMVELCFFIIDGWKPFSLSMLVVFIAFFFSSSTVSL